MGFRLVRILRKRCDGAALRRNRRATATIDFLLNRWVAALLAAGCAAYSQPAAACALQAPGADTGLDASSALQDCVREHPHQRILMLPPGTYRLRHPLQIDEPISITTAGLLNERGSCNDLPPGRCAVLIIDPENVAANAGAMPIEITADGVTLDHLIIRGDLPASQQHDYCRTPAKRPMAGGIRVSASNFTLTKSRILNIGCYSALEITSGANGAVITANVIGPNGMHGEDKMWSDGVTVHDSSATRIIGNQFIDNTDVQLIFGGCRDCRIEGNRFRHGGSFGSASFAELMLQAWPSTSGDYSGTIVRGNSINCGPRRRCGYGIMIGSAPWYDGPASGAAVVSNAVSNAMIAINIDTATGPVQMHGNIVRNSGGLFPSDCGVKAWPAVNVSPQSQRYVSGDPSNIAHGSISTRRCLLNRQDSSTSR